MIVTDVQEEVDDGGLQFSGKKVIFRGSLSRKM